MAGTKDDAASEAARALVARRWGSQVVERAAAVVIERAAELPAAVREQVHQVTGEAAADG
jgi:hypothetical protein